MAGYKPKYCSAQENCFHILLPDQFSVPAPSQITDRPRRRRRLGLSDLFEPIVSIANAPRGDQRQQFLDYQFNEHFPKVGAVGKLLVEIGVKLSSTEERYWAQHHAAIQTRVILEALGLKEKIEAEGFTPENIQLLSEKLRTVPDDWKYGVEPGSKAYAAVKKNEGEFLKWYWANRRAKRQRADK